MPNDIELPEFPTFTQTYHHAPYAAISPSRPELSAAGKVVVVTGGGTGIGRSIAVSFAQAGADTVAILGRREDRLKSSVAEISAANQKTKVLYKVADLTKRADVDAALSSIVDSVGNISIFVSNAGASPPPTPFTQIDEHTFMEGFDMNVRTAFNAVQAFLPLAATDAILISISSGVAHCAPILGVSAYAASKAANLKMLDYVAAEHPQLHVVNLQPGVIITEIQKGAKMEGQDDGEHIEALNIA